MSTDSGYKCVYTQAHSLFMCTASVDCYCRLVCGYSPGILSVQQRVFFPITKTKECQKERMKVSKDNMEQGETKQT